MKSAGWWKRIERNIGPEYPYYLTDDDECYWAREFASHQDYKYSETNQLIKNFKRDPIQYKDRPDVLWHKENAIKKYALELCLIFNNLDVGSIITNVPTSKTKSDPNYDNRFERLFEKLKSYNQQLRVDYPLSIKSSHTAVHISNAPRFSPDDFYDILDWNNISNNNCETIYLIDDVITAGAHFKACQRKIYDNVRNVKVIGIFWARTIHPMQQIVECNF
jgi:hypothetical protein